MKKVLVLGALLTCGVLNIVAQNSQGHDSQGNDSHGLSRGFVTADFPFESIFIGTDFTEIQHMSLPPGNYLANASAVVASNDPQFHEVDCFFTVNGGVQGTEARGLVGGTLNNFHSLPLTTGFSIAAPSVLGVACISDTSRIVVSQQSSITAITVDRLTIQH